MKRTVITLSIAALSLAFAGTSLAQGRHDEKPHGSANPSAGVTWVAPATGGRHDEGPYAHRPRPSVTKKSESPAAAGVKPSPDAETCCNK
jgi:hypothetical protein